MVKQIDIITKGDQNEEKRINKSMLGSLCKVEINTKTKLGKRQTTLTYQCIKGNIATFKNSLPKNNK